MKRCSTNSTVTLTCRNAVGPRCSRGRSRVSEAQGRRSHYPPIPSRISRCGQAERRTRRMGGRGRMVGDEMSCFLEFAPIVGPLLAAGITVGVLLHIRSAVTQENALGIIRNLADGLEKTEPNIIHIFRKLKKCQIDKIADAESFPIFPEQKDEFLELIGEFVSGGSISRKGSIHFMKQALNRLNALEVALIAHSEKVGYQKIIERHIEDVYKDTIVNIKLGYFLKKESWEKSYSCIVHFQPGSFKYESGSLENKSNFFKEQMQELEENESLERNGQPRRGDPTIPGQPR